MVTATLPETFYLFLYYTSSIKLVWIRDSETKSLQAVIGNSWRIYPHEMLDKNVAFYFSYCIEKKKDKILKERKATTAVNINYTWKSGGTIIK